MVKQMRLIDADALLNRMTKAMESGSNLNGTFHLYIEHAPTIQRPTGEWIQKDMCADRFCSECNYAVWDSEAEEYNFCPNCGAKMFGEDGEA